MADWWVGLRRRGAAVAAALMVAACSHSVPNAAPAPARVVGVEVVLGDTGPRPADQHPTPEPASGAALATDGHHGHGDNASARTELPASPELTRQLGMAKRRAVALMSLRRLADADYFVGSYYSTGVGSHYINWPLLDMPFMPDMPTMLLVDTTPGHIPRLAGFSYWVRSTKAPEGFAGDADQWHAHRGMCFVDEVETDEDVASPADCAGTWVDGGDLWMLHAWVVPGYENPDGVFAPVNRKLCPPRRGSDAMGC